MSLRFWEKKVPPAIRTVEVVRRSSLKLRLAEWQADPKLVSQAGKLLSDETFRCMLDVAHNENPSNFVLPFGTTPQDRAAQQCRSEGYTMALANLEAMGQSRNIPETVEPTFEPEEIGTQTA